MDFLLIMIRFLWCIKSLQASWNHSNSCPWWHPHWMTGSTVLICFIYSFYVLSVCILSVQWNNSKMKDKEWPILTFFLSLCVLSSSFAFKGSYWQLGITEPQTQRVVKVGRPLWELSSPSVLLKQGQLLQDSERPVQLGFEYFQRLRLHNHSGQPAAREGSPS